MILKDELNCDFEEIYYNQSPEKPRNNSFIDSEDKTELIIDVPKSDIDVSKSDIKPLAESDCSVTVQLFAKPEYYSVGSAINIGKRKYQQDSVVISNNDFTNPCKSNKVFAVLSDGMGGLNGGEKASYICTSQMLESYGMWDKILDYPSFIKQNLVDIDSEIFSLKNDKGDPLGAGATIVCCAIEEDNMYWATVGDSHIYHINSQGIKQLNKDHNYKLQLDQMVQNGEITAAMAESNAQKEALISYMGIGGLSMIDQNIQPIQLEQNDIILLCSDGLYRVLSEEEIFSIVTNEKTDIPLLANMLINHAIDKQYKYQDNISAILIKKI